MKWLFCSMMYTDLDKDITNTKNPNSISGHKFQWNLIDGLTKNHIDLEIFNTQRIRPFPYNKKLFVTEDNIKNVTWKGMNIRFINIPFLNYFSQYLSLKKILNRVINNNKNDKIVLLVFNTQFVQSKAVLSMKKRYPNIVTCNIVGDLYGKYGLKVTSTGFQKVWQSFVEKKQESMQTEFEKYVILTPMMQQALAIKSQNCTVVEGFYEKSEVDFEHIKEIVEENQKIVFYAGSLKLAYGIEHLLKAFQLIKHANYSLYIAGSGDGEELVKKYSENDKRVKLLGFLSPNDVKKYQKKATVLVSPRMSNELFVKYSFPSKTFECLASGKPYVAHKLPCEPPEYSQYIQYPKDESDSALSEEIIRICEMNPHDRYLIAKKAYDFIINEKNTKVMCRRIVDLIESSFEVV